MMKFLLLPAFWKNYRILLPVPWRPDFLWTGTDIDLIVKGLEDERYFEILADISRISHPFHVDLIPFEKAWPSMKKRALKEGLRLA